MHQNKLIDPRFIDRLLGMINCSTVVSRYVNLQRKGKDYFGCCPFHHEKTASFSVNDIKGFYHCFGCGAHGTPVDFVKKMHGYNFVEAIEFLAGIINIPVQYEQSINSKDQQTERNEKDILYKILEDACKWFELRLYESENAYAFNYLKNRGLKDDVIKLFRLGYAPDSGKQSLHNYLKSKNYPDNILLKTGIFSEKYNKIYNYFFNRIIFPIFDPKGKVIAFGGRILNEGEPKYLNSPETILFKKNSVFYGLNFARDNIYKSNNALIVEGYMDVISLYNHGIANAIAPLGTAFTNNHLEIIWNIINEPTLCFDGDFAGQKATNKVVINALPAINSEKLLKIISLPEKCDPDDFIKTRGAINFNKIVNNASTISQYLWNYNSSKYKLDVAEEKAKLNTLLNNLVKQVKDNDLNNNLKNYFKQKLFESSNFNKNNNITAKKQHLKETMNNLDNISLNLSRKDILGLQMLYMFIHYQKIHHNDDFLEFISQINYRNNDFINLQNFIINYITNSYNIAGDKCNLNDALFITNLLPIYKNLEKIILSLLDGLAEINVISHFYHLMDLYTLELMYEEYNNLLQNSEQSDIIVKVSALDREIKKLESKIRLKNLESAE